MAHTLTRAALALFSGTETWFRHPLDRSVLYTEGARHVAEAGGAYWLLDVIVLSQRAVPAVAAERFQLWRLTVRPDRTATLACEDGNGKPVFTQLIPHTDFPLDDFSFYFTDSTILLPGEY